MPRIVDHEIDFQAMLEAVRSPECGAALVFVGTTRQFTRGRETERLEYQAYEAMAEQELAMLEQESIEKFGLVRCQMMHRIGEVPVGGISVVVAVGSRHREAAFRASEWIMDQLKQRIPVWKKETWTDGETAWIHPGLAEVDSNRRGQQREVSESDSVGERNDTQ